MVYVIQGKCIGGQEIEWPNEFVDIEEAKLCLEKLKRNKELIAESLMIVEVEPRDDLWRRICEEIIKGMNGET